jgi:hypothetical protein
MTTPPADPIVTALRLALAEIAARRAQEATETAERRAKLSIKQGGKAA